MSSALKNFLITFVISLTVFLLIGLNVISPWLSEIVALPDPNGENSGDVSQDDVSDTSDTETSFPEVSDVEYDEKGDVFTAVIFCVDSENRALETFFIDSNGKTKQFIKCSIPKTTRVTNEIGVGVPVGDLFGMISSESVCQLVSTMTGIKTDYALCFDKKSVKTLARLIGSPTVNADEIASTITKEPISIMNPAYKDVIFPEGDSKPSDYYFNLTGNINLNKSVHGKTYLEWLLEYNPHGDQGSGGDYNSVYAYVFAQLIDQFFKNESNLKNVSSMTKLISACDTNLTADQATEHLETIFSYDDFQRHEVIYPSHWVDGVNLLRRLDKGESDK